MLATLLLAAVFPALALADSVVTIVNSGSSTISPQLFGINNGVANPAPLAPGASVNVTLNANFDGIIYVGTGAGNDGQLGATKAALQLVNNYYYVLLDSGFNFGVTIVPSVIEENGFCAPVTCATANCTTAFHSSPNVPPPANTTAPQPPLFECPGTNNAYTVTFSQNGSSTPPPPPASVQINPNGNTAKCLDVRAAVLANGTPVQIYDCNGTGAQKWVINKGDTKVQVAGTNFCLDAGTTPANNVGMKIWTCFANLPAQAWFYTDDNRIAVTGKGQCLDLTNGNLANTNQVQTFQCTAGNTNQIWTTTTS